MSDAKPDRKEMLLRYGELMMRKARDEVGQEELLEMEKIESSLGGSKEKLIAEIEQLVKKNY